MIQETIARPRPDAIEPALLAAHAFAPFDMAVDVGGGQGSLLCGVLARHPDARGILFDLPEIADGPDSAWSASAEADRISPWGGDFFRSVPVADLYLLKDVLGEWTDAHCRVILRAIRSAIVPQGRVAIVDLVMPDDAGPHAGYPTDLTMMGVMGGRERSVTEYSELFRATGFRLERVTPLPSHLSVLEAVAV